MRLRLLRILLLLFGSVFVFVFGCNAWVLLSTKKLQYTEADSMPYRPVGLVLGTSKSLDGKLLNPYFQDRITAATSAIKSARVSHLIVSGDNSLVTYNEPRDMRQALISNGVNGERISMDFAGFRTFDSIVRCKEIFDQNAIVIISQPFHTPRALFIARAKRINAIALNCPDDYTSWTTPIYWREVLARCKTVIDLYILNKSPKYLGEKEQIDVQNNGR